VLEEHLKLSNEWEDEAEMRCNFSEDLRRTFSATSPVLTNRGIFPWPRRGQGAGGNGVGTDVGRETAHSGSFQHITKAIGGRMEFLEWAHKDVEVRIRGAGPYPTTDEDRRPDNPLHHGGEALMNKMDEQQAHQFLTELLSNLSPEEEYNVRHQDYMLEMPQSGERFRGWENMRAVQEAYPTRPPSIRLRRVLVKEGLWVVEGIADYSGGHVYDIVLILELRDGKMWRDRWYFAEPFEAPEWRAQWVERMEA
jgi:hypothetical protein